LEARCLGEALAKRPLALLAVADWFRKDVGVALISLNSMRQRLWERVAGTPGRAQKGTSTGSRTPNDRTGPVGHVHY
jgi:hypothetical protein